VSRHLREGPIAIALNTEYVLSLKLATTNPGIVIIQIKSPNRNGARLGFRQQSAWQAFERAIAAVRSTITAFPLIRHQQIRKVVVIHGVDAAFSFPWPGPAPVWNWSNWFKTHR
jgi:hypothetical protein